MPESTREYLRAVARFLEARSPEERRKRGAHALALVLVAAVAAVKSVTGLTDEGAPFTLYALAVAAGAARGGLETGLVATLGSILAAAIVGAPAAGTARLLFAAEGLSIALVVSVVRSHVRMRESQLVGAERTVADLRGRVLHAQRLDETRRHEWDEYRQAVARAQAALQGAADEAKKQLAALESLTDPSLNPLGGDAMVTELLERLRGSVGADGAALVQPGRGRMAVVTSGGLQPTSGPLDTDAQPPLAAGRVAVVHNDPARVAQLSALRWPATATSLLVVPVLHDGRVWSTIEVVSERSRQVSDWDVALARVAADRLAAVVVQGHGRGVRAS
jgi:hypothetical protein